MRNPTFLDVLRNGVAIASGPHARLFIGLIQHGEQTVKRAHELRQKAEEHRPAQDGLQRLLPGEAAVMLFNTNTRNAAASLALFLLLYDW